eukprot:1958861-Rhodomonas_salina.1
MVAGPEVFGDTVVSPDFRVSTSTAPEVSFVSSLEVTPSSTSSIAELSSIFMDIEIKLTLMQACMSNNDLLVDLTVVLVSHFSNQSVGSVADVNITALNVIMN